MNSLPSWPWHVGFLSLREHYTDATLYVVFLKFDLYLGRYMGFHARDCMWIWKYRENRHFNRHFLETATHSTTPLFSCTDHNQQTTVTHFGENRRLHLESSKQNYYIISLWVIIKAIFTSPGVLRVEEDLKTKFVRVVLKPEWSRAGTGN